MGFIQQTPNFSTKRGNIPPDTSLPETNMAPKTGGFQYNRFQFFRCHASFREGNTWILSGS